MWAAVRTGGDEGEWGVECELTVTDEEIDEMTEGECRHLFLAGYAKATFITMLGEDGYRAFLERLQQQNSTIGDE